MVVIKQIHIVRFGRLSDYTLNFGSGLNSLVANNSTGKSTIVMFIKAMLYGMEYKNVYSKIKDSIMYQPWDSTELYGGYLIYQLNGKEYKIHRMMGTRPNQERVSHTECATGKQLSCDDIGHKLFGLNRESFDKTLFVPQADVVISNNDTFATKLTSIVEGGSNNNYHKALEVLNDERKKYKHDRGNGGSLNKLTGEIIDIDEQISRLAQERIRADRLQQEMVGIQAELEGLHAQKQALTNAIDKLAVEKASNTLSDIEKEQLRQLAEAKVYLDSHASHANLSGDIEQCNNLLNQANNTPPKKKISHTGKVALWTTTALSVVIAVVLAILINYAMLSILIVPILMYIVLQCTAKESVDNNRTGAIDIISRYMHFNNDIDECMARLYTYQEQYNRARAVISQLDGKVNMGGDNTALEEQYNANKSQLAVVEETIKQLTLKLGQHESTVQHINSGDNTAQLNDLRADKVLQQQLETYRYNVVVKCIEIIKQAKENMAVAYVPRLATRCQQLLKQLSLGVFDCVEMDDKLKVDIIVNGISRNIEYFSQGTKELVVFCLRIALAEAMYQDGIPLLIIDDAFVNLDEEKFQAVMNLLTTISNNTQIIYMSCHSRSKRI